MTWAKLDDRMHDDERTIAAGLEAMGLWSIALSFMGDHLTDGHITRERVTRIAGRRGPKLALRLVEVGWWEPTATGFRLISWEKFLFARSEVEANRAHKSEIGRRGGEAKAAKVKDSGLALRQNLSVARSQIQSNTKSNTNQISEGGNGSGVEDEQPSLPGIEASPPKGVALENAVFAEYLAARTVKGRAPVLDEKRRGMIRGRLADGFTPDDLKAAARGIWRSEFHTKPENQKKGFCGFEYVVRDAKAVERFRELGRGDAISEDPFAGRTRPAHIPEGGPPRPRFIQEDLARYRSAKERGEALPPIRSADDVVAQLSASMNTKWSLPDAAEESS